MRYMQRLGARENKKRTVRKQERDKEIEEHRLIEINGGRTEENARIIESVTHLIML